MTHTYNTWKGHTCAEEHRDNCYILLSLLLLLLLYDYYYYYYSIIIATIALSLGWGFNKDFLQFRARRRDVSHIIIIIDYYWHTTIIIPAIESVAKRARSSFIIKSLRHYAIYYCLRGICISSPLFVIAVYRIYRVLFMIADFLSLSLHKRRGTTLVANY